MENTIKLELRPLLAGVECPEGGCYKRLEQTLEKNSRLQRVHLELDRDPAVLCLHYDPEVISLSEVSRLAQRCGAQVHERYHHETLPVEGMDCSDCALVLEHSLKRMEGVLAVSVNYAAQKMTVEYDSRQISRGAIERRVRNLGYEFPLQGARSWLRENGELLMSGAAGLLTLVGWLVGSLTGLDWLSIGLFLVAYVVGGWEIAHHAWHAIRERELDTDLLMLAAALGAAALGEFGEGALLIFLFSLGHALEERALDRARQAVRALGDLTPRTARVRREGAVLEVPVEQVELDETVLVLPGVRLPVDGVVLAGHSAVNQAPVTGESMPVEKAPGAPVYAGSVNGEAALEVRVTRLARDSTLARVMKLVEEAQGQKSNTQKVVDRFSRIFVPLVLVATALVVAVPPFFGLPFHESFLRGMTLLVAASPCALALGAPAAVLAGIAQAARHGVLIKGGAYLENLGQLKAVAFDKTGTLTTGRPAVTGVWRPASSPLAAENDVLALAAALEARSAHPLAQAVVTAAREAQLALPEVGAVETLTGRGLRAGQVLAGNLAWLEAEGVALLAELQAQAADYQANGCTVIALASDGQAAGLIALADTLRPQAAEMLRQLKQAGVKETVLLTGDAAAVAQKVAAQTGVTQVMAELLPEDKLKAVRELTERYGAVAMVGDGVNDAPALAHATVGVAMGGAGTDVALETADVALMGDDLSRLPFAVRLGRASRAVIIQNLVIALGVIALLAVASVTGLVSMGVAIFFHEGSTIVVVLNALRLLRFEA